MIWLDDRRVVGIVSIGVDDVLPAVAIEVDQLEGRGTVAGWKYKQSFFPKGLTIFVQVQKETFVSLTKQGENIRLAIPVEIPDLRFDGPRFIPQQSSLKASPAPDSATNLNRRSTCRTRR